MLLFTALDSTSITSHIQNWVLFLLWLHLFILSEIISPLISSSILGTYQPRDSTFCIIFLSFHTVHGVLKARILKRLASPSSSGPVNIQKTKIMASGPITSWEIDGETVETVSDFIFWKSLQMVIAAMKLKDAYSLEEKL